MNWLSLGSVGCCRNRGISQSRCRWRIYGLAHGWTLVLLPRLLLPVLSGAHQISWQLDACES